MDPVATSFIVFFALFVGGFVTLLCIGFIIHCCCSVDLPRYCAEISDEAIVCERLTKKERVEVFEKVFASYDTVVSIWSLVYSRLIFAIILLTLLCVLKLTLLYS